MRQIKAMKRKTGNSLGLGGHTYHSQLTIFQYEKSFAQAANWNLNRNLLRANCQSKYQHCVTILQSGAQTNNRFHCRKNLSTCQISCYSHSSILHVSLKDVANFIVAIKWWQFYLFVPARLASHTDMLMDSSRVPAL